MQWLMLQQEKPEDFVIATGQQHSVRECLELAAKELNMEIEWKGQGADEKGYSTKTGKQIIAVDSRYYRPTEVETLLGDASKAREKLGWQPKISFHEMISEMVQQDLAEAQRDHLCKTHGFDTFDYNE
jgi:GDPmannose 4,6-dehydratase